MRTQKGCTLTELPVVIAIIAILPALLMRTLKAVREQGKRTVFLSNLKQLAVGWMMYADANDDRICTAYVGGRDIQRSRRLSGRARGSFFSVKAGGRAARGVSGMTDRCGGTLGNPRSCSTGM